MLLAVARIIDFVGYRLGYFFGRDVQVGSDTLQIHLCPLAELFDIVYFTRDGRTGYHQNRGCLFHIALLILSTL